MLLLMVTYQTKFQLSSTMLIMDIEIRLRVSSEERRIEIALVSSDTFPARNG